MTGLRGMLEKMTSSPETLLFKFFNYLPCPN